MQPQRLQRLRPPRKSTKILLKEIRAKWSKLSEQDLSALKSKDDLVSQVVAKYGLEKAQAQRDVDAGFPLDRSMRRRMRHVQGRLCAL